MPNQYHLHAGTMFDRPEADCQITPWGLTPLIYAMNISA